MIDIMKLKIIEIEIVDQFNQFDRAYRKFQEEIKKEEKLRHC